MVAWKRAWIRMELPDGRQRKTATWRAVAKRRWGAWRAPGTVRVFLVGRLPAWLAAVCLAASATGCAWLRRNPHAEGPLPPAPLEAGASLEEVIEAVNANSRAVRQLQATGASLKVVGVPPTLSAELVVERPRRLRLTAQVSRLIGKEIDLGSNDEIFWLWIRRAEQPAIFYARHDRFAQSPAAEWLSINPVWLLDAIGLVQIDPKGQHQGPLPLGMGRLEVRTRLPTPRGTWTRVLIVDARYGWPLEQNLYDSAGRLIASAVADRFRYDKENDVSLPHRVRVRINPDQPSELDMELTVTTYQINSLMGAPELLWEPPRIDNAPMVDVTRPGFVPQMLPPPPAGAPPLAHWNDGYAPRR